MWTILLFGLAVLYAVAEVIFLMRALLRPHREPSARMAWVLVILMLPLFGMVAYLFFGETNIGRRRAARYRETRASLMGDADTDLTPDPDEDTDPRHGALFRTGQSISGFRPVAGNLAETTRDTEDTISRMVADIDAATRHVHVLFYIWLEDSAGLRVVEALKRAAGRGVDVRAMADDIGSRGLIWSDHWSGMEAAGVRLARALPIGNPLFHPIRGRVDLRNHRKIVVIDNRITYCGSQNCSDAEFSPKPRYSPWVDLVVRFEGPIARQNQWLFVQDWMAHVDEDLRLLPGEAPEGTAPGDEPAGTVLAQVNGTGPTVRTSAMPEMFEALLHGARRELVLTTPYYVPTEAMQSAICAAAYRGVRVRMVLPGQNDSMIVAAASRSYYHDLLKAGVRLFEFRGGLLHAKSVTLDGEVAMIGSANLDRRSFELNYENNILCRDAALTAEILSRQESYIEQSVEITLGDVRAWGLWRRLWYNAIAMMGPVL